VVISQRSVAFSFSLVPFGFGLLQRRVSNMSDYNGWKNWETWNVALWIQNDEGLYALAKEIADSKYSRPYDGIVNNLNDIGITTTPDGASYGDRNIDHAALDRMIRSL
jgi:hypothetical protein